MQSIETLHLPEAIKEVLSGFTAHAREVLGRDLLAAILYGSAAEERLRKASDVNLLLVLDSFDYRKIAGLRERMRIGFAAVQLRVMFLLRSELPRTIQAFPVKFLDIAHRHRLLFGENPLNDFHIPDATLVAAASQVLLNQRLRLRENYLLASLREEQMVRVVAGTASALRSSAAALRYVRDKEYLPPREALNEFAEERGDEILRKAVHAISGARIQESLSGDIEDVLTSIQRLIDALLVEAGG